MCVWIGFIQSSWKINENVENPISSGIIDVKFMLIGSLSLLGRILSILNSNAVCQIWKLGLHYSILVSAPWFLFFWFSGFGAKGKKKKSWEFSLGCLPILTQFPNFLAPTGAQEVALSVCVSVRPSVCVWLLWILHSILILSSSNLQGLFRVSSGSLQGLFRVSSGSLQGLFRVS